MKIKLTTVHVDDQEIGLMAARGAHVAHCPTTALKVSYGVTQIGKIPEMVMRGINVAIGTDGNNASNYSDLMRATYLVAGLFKDARMDPQMCPAEKAYEMATLGGARLMQLESEIGSLEPGKRADLVLQLEVARFDPRLALDGGVDGLDFYRRIALEALARMAPDGCVMLEFGAGQEMALQETFVGGWWIEDIKKDLAGKPRILIAHRAQK